MTKMYIFYRTLYISFLIEGVLLMIFENNEKKSTAIIFWRLRKKIFTPEFACFSYNCILKPIYPFWNLTLLKLVFKNSLYC